MNKTAQLPAATLKAILPRMLAGATVGGLHGYYVMPKATGYEDIHSARNLSMILNVLAGAALGNAAGRMGGWAPLAREAVTNFPKYKGPAAAVVAADLAPNVLATLKQQRDASLAQADAAKVTSIPYNLQQFAQSGLGKGIAGGAAVAGLGGLLTGLLRRRNQQEEVKDTGRATMVGGDMLKFLLPAMAAGGIIGSLKGQQS